MLQDSNLQKSRTRTRTRTRTTLERERERRGRGVNTLLWFLIVKFIFERMQNVLKFPAPGRPEHDSSSAFNVVIAYEDFETGKHAKKTYDYLAEHLGRDCQFSQQMWKFDVLAVPKLRDIAARDAAAADIIIVSAHGTNPLPDEVTSWIQMWLAEGCRAIALVALFDSEEYLDNPARAQLAAAARRGGMEFFSQPGLWPGNDADEWKNTQPHDPKDLTFSALAGAMRQQTHGVSHWGINE